VSLALHPGIPAPAAAGMACQEDARAGDPRTSWLLGGGWPSCGMTPGAEPDPVPTGGGGDQPTWACRSVVMVWALRRVSSPLVLTPPLSFRSADSGRLAFRLNS
jgi:hypothetical protein